MTKFETLFTSTPETLEAKKLPGRVKTAKRSMESFTDNLQYEVLEDINAREERAMMSFVKGDKDAIAEIINCRLDKKALADALAEAELLKKELF